MIIEGETENSLKLIHIPANFNPMKLIHSLYPGQLHESANSSDSIF